MTDDLARPDQLVDALYDLALDPSRFEQFAYAWDNFVQLESIGEDSDAERALQAHFERAFLILEKVGRSTNKNQSLQQIIAHRTGPALCVDKLGIVQLTNSRAEELLSSRCELAGQKLSDFVHEKSRNQLIERLRSLNSNEELVPLLVLLENNVPCLFALSPGNEPDQILIDITGAYWQESVSEFLLETHNLTQVELEVAKLLYQGLSLSQIAAERNRSVETIRKHLASLFDKTDCRTQAQLMKLVTSATYARDRSKARSWFRDRTNIEKHKLSDGRTLYYFDKGESGAPALVLIHPYLRTPELPEALERELLNAGYRLIAPCRAGFGESTALSEGQPPMRTAVEDLQSLLRKLEVQTFDLIGLMGGAIHCLETAKQLPDRVNCIINLAASLPLTTNKQIENMPPSTRAVAYTAKKFPRIFPLLVRTGVAMVDTGDPDKLINSLYRKSPRDLEAAQIPETRDWVFKGGQFASYQGYLPYTTELAELAKFKFDYADQITCPVIFIHAKEDMFNSLDSIKSFCAPYENFELVPLEDSCHLMIYAEPERTAKELLASLEKVSSR